MFVRVSMFLLGTTTFRFDLMLVCLPGTFCNHYFLRMLAMIGRGQYDAAYELGEFCNSLNFFPPLRTYPSHKKYS